MTQVNRPHKDRITISFERFQCLRAIVDALKKEDKILLSNLLNKLDYLERTELSELWAETI